MCPKYWVKFEHHFPYINISRISMDCLLKLGGSKGFVQYISPTGTTEIANMITIGKVAHCSLISAERVTTTEVKSVKQIKFRFLTQEFELARAAICHVFNRASLTCNVWNGDITAGTKFGDKCKLFYLASLHALSPVFYSFNWGCYQPIFNFKDTS